MGQIQTSERDLEAKGGLQLTASREMETSIPQPQGTEFCQQLEISLGAYFGYLSFLRPSKTALPAD